MCRSIRSLNSCNLAVHQLSLECHRTNLSLLTAGEWKIKLNNILRPTCVIAYCRWTTFNSQWQWTPLQKTEAKLPAKKTAEFHFYGHENMKFNKRRSRTKKGRKQSQRKNTQYKVLPFIWRQVDSFRIRCCLLYVIHSSRTLDLGIGRHTEGLTLKYTALEFGSHLFTLCLVHPGVFLSA